MGFWSGGASDSGSICRFRDMLALVVVIHLLQVNQIRLEICKILYLVQTLSVPPPSDLPHSVSVRKAFLIIIDSAASVVGSFGDHRFHIV